MKIKHRQILTEDQIKQLEQGKMYGLYAEPGSGKTYFFQNTLIPYCRQNDKTILFLVHRLTLKDQTNADLEEEIETWQKQFRGNGIIITTYQAIEYAYKKEFYDKVKPLLKMDFVVCDESHYFVKESWNEQTDYSVQFMEDSKGIKLFMTGTPKEMYVLNKMWKVEQLVTVNRNNNNIVAIRVYEKPSDLINDINQYANDKCKVLSFVSGYAGDVLNLKNKHGGSFIVSKRREGFYSEADKELIKSVVKGENAESMGLLPTNKIWSTSVWNEGVNIIDPNLKVICSFQPRTSTEFIQQAARARRSDILLCIVAPTKKMLVGHLQKYRDKLDVIYELRQEKNNPKLARMAELYFLESIRETEEMLEHNCFASYVQSVYKSVPVIDYGHFLRNRELTGYLNTLVNEKMFSEKQKQFKDTLIEEYGVRDSNRKKIAGRITINNYLREAGIDYEIISKKERSKKSAHQGQTYWMFKKCTKNDASPIYSNSVKNSTLLSEIESKVIHVDFVSKNVIVEKEDVHKQTNDVLH